MTDEEFKDRYKESTSIDTPNLWDRIENGIDGVKPGCDSKSNYVNNGREEKLDRKQAIKIKKILSLTACACILIIVGITASEVMFGGPLIGSSANKDSDVQREPGIDNTNSSLSEEKALEVINSRIRILSIDDEYGDTYIVKAMLVKNDMDEKSISIITSGSIAIKLKKNQSLNAVIEHNVTKDEYYMKSVTEIEKNKYFQ